MGANLTRITKRKNLIPLTLFAFSMQLLFGTTTHAQITQTCETTMIYQPGIGWIEGSEITTCDIIWLPVNDGSGLLDNMENSCGQGNACPTAPDDTDEGTTDEQMCQLEQGAESDEDRLANEIADDIRDRNTEQSNPNNAEYGAFILRLDNGEYVRVPIGTSGSSGQVSLRGMLDAAIASYPGVTGANVVGIVHSHPSESGPGFLDVSDINDLSPVDYGNTMPSHPNITMGPNDWVNGRNFLLANGRTSVSDVTHYIVGPDGVLRQYNYANGHPAESSAQYDLINAAEANATGDCDEILD